MQKVKVNSVVKLYTLCLLSNGPKHGYEIIKKLESGMNQRISASHVYPFLKSLEQNKIISYKDIEQREKKSYGLTKNGEDFVSLILENLGEVLETAIESKISTCIHCKCKVYGNVHKELVKKREYSFCCKHCASAYKETMLLNV